MYELDTQIKRNITCQKCSGRPDVIGHLDMRMFFPQELDALLKYNGFRIHQKYGDYGGTEFGKGSGKQLIVAAAAQDRNGQRSGAADALPRAVDL